MSTWASNSYVRVPPDLEAMEVLEDVHAHLLEACKRDKDLARKWLEVRLRHQPVRSGFVFTESVLS